MLFSAKLGHQYWDYAIRYASVVLMKISGGYDDISAWERYTGRDKNVKEIREFGEYCYVQIPQEIRRKNRFDTKKAVLGRVIGIEIGTSRWLMMVKELGGIVASRDVVKASGQVLTPDAVVSEPRRFTTFFVESKGEEEEIGDKDRNREIIDVLPFPDGMGETTDEIEEDNREATNGETTVAEGITAAEGIGSPIIDDGLGSPVPDDIPNTITLPESRYVTRSVTGNSQPRFIDSITLDDDDDLIRFFGRDARWHHLAS